MTVKVLWDVEFFPEVIFLLHDVGQTFVRNVEEINEGLDIATFEQVGAYPFPVVIFKVLAVDDQVADLLFEPLFVAELVQVVVLTTYLVEEDGRAGDLDWLLEGLYLALFLTVLASRESTPERSYPFIIEQ